MPRLAGSSKLLRAMNESAALAHLLDPGMLTRSDLRKLTALSTPTISEVLRRLTDAGLVNVVGHNSGRPGPNAEIYAANPEAAYTAAVSVRDIGTSGTPSVAAALCDLTGAVRARFESRVDFLAAQPAAALVDVVARLRDEAGVPGDRIRHVQLGVPGSYDVRTETIRHVDVPGFARAGLIPEIAAALGTHIGVDNDVNLAAVAERKRGTGRDADGFALLWIGQDGLGLAIDIAGTLIRGARGGAGEIGYMPLYSPDSADRKLDLQDLFGGAAILELARDNGIAGETPAAVVRAATAPPTDSPGLGRGTAPPTDSPGLGRNTAPPTDSPGLGRNTAAPGEFIHALADRIAIGLAAVTAVLDPYLVVLAGPIAQAGGDTLLAAVTAASRRTAPLESTIAVTSLDDDAVLLGALDAGLTAVREALITAIRDS